MCKPLGQALAQREEAHFQPLDEEREPQHHEHKPADHAAEIGKRLAQDRNLKDRDHDDDRGEIAKRAEHEAGNGEKARRRPILLQTGKYALRLTTGLGVGVGGRIHCDSGSDSYAI